MVHYLVYISVAANALPEDELKAIMHKSVTNNQRDQLSGMLLYCGGKFMQVLEGQKENVMQTFERIMMDHRHKRIAVILEGQVEQRNFAGWNLGFKSMNTDELETLSGYRDIQDFFSETTITDSSHPALVFLKLFYQKNNSDLISRM
ncbi:MAG: BLUF domain-containing protein [Cytophagales bacterium]|nr:BLUF domain-containing protein [Cytophagales bacterium]